MSPPTRDNAVPCRGCLLASCDPSVAGAEAAAGTSLDTTVSAVGVGDAHESNRINIITVGKSVLYLILLFIYYVS